MLDIFDSSQCGLISVGDVKEAIFVFSLIVNVAHQRISFEKISAINEEIKRACLWKLDSLSDNVVEMIGAQIVWDQVFSLINVRQLRGVAFLTDDWNPIWVPLSDFVGLSFSLAEVWMGLLVL